MGLVGDGITVLDVVLESRELLVQHRVCGCGGNVHPSFQISSDRGVSAVSLATRPAPAYRVSFQLKHDRTRNLTQVMGTLLPWLRAARQVQVAVARC